MPNVLGMGGGGPEENISGEVNGVNMTDPSVAVSMSTNLSSFLTGYPINVASGTYNASLAEVQAAFSSLSWGAPVLISTQTVIQQAGFGQGFIFSTNSAHLFSFQAEEVGVEVPAPSILSLMGIGLFGIVLAARRRQRAT